MVNKTSINALLYINKMTFFAYISTVKDIGVLLDYDSNYRVLV
jgi:hypothetical protein